MPRVRWKYYFDTPSIDFNNFNHENAYNFIRGTYDVGAKEKIFDVGFQKLFHDQGKHQHTVALYFLGCQLSNMLHDKLKDHIGLYIKKMDWYDFKYTWFLTCLYHDTAAVIEKSEYSRNSPKDLNSYLGRYNVVYNVYGHIWENNHNKPYTYPETLVKNYFIYRTEYGHALDHGIIAGYLLYDRLKKNYDSSWENVKSENYNDFYYKHVRWRIEHLSHFAYVANAIIAHNIWHSEKTDESKHIYKQYGLDPLIYLDPRVNGESNMISVHKDPLVFYLGLLDTIEPIKFFMSECDIDSIWKAIQIEYDTNNRTLNIKTDGSLFKNREWFHKIKSIVNWLDVSIYEPEPDREIHININSLGRNE